MQELSGIDNLRTLKDVNQNIIKLPNEILQKIFDLVVDENIKCLDKISFISKHWNSYSLSEKKKIESYSTIKNNFRAEIKALSLGNLEHSALFNLELVFIDPIEDLNAHFAKEKAVDLVPIYTKAAMECNNVELNSPRRIQLYSSAL